MVPLTLNQGQLNVESDFIKFLFSEDKEFSISGPGGTGKTYLLKQLIHSTLKDYTNSCTLLGKKPVDYSVNLTATTNKAAEVLSDALGLPTSTIHSFLSLKVQDDYQTGTQKLTKTANFSVHSRSLIFIDEASMIDSALYRILHEGTDKTCKIVYIGDHCQMAPVFEKLSPVYKNTKRCSYLTEPMRNASQPALVNLCNQLRNTVETGVFQPIPHVPGVIDFVNGEEAEEFLEQTFVDREASCRALAYSNKRATEFLQYIRNIRGLPQVFTTGEVVINNSGLQISKITLRVEQEIEVARGFTSYEIVNLPNKAGDSMRLEAYSIELKLPASKLVVYVAKDPALLRTYSKRLAKLRDWEHFFALKKMFPDLRGMGACTVYKAQGSTYDSVFLDLENIGSCTDSDQLARMLYVAVSRARHRVVLYGDLPYRLFKQAA